MAYAAQHAGVSATVVMPTTTPLVKVNNTKDYGADVVLHGATFDDAAELAAQLSEDGGLHLSSTPSTTRRWPPARAPSPMEIFSDLPDVDIILVPVGGGGLAAGVSTLAKLLNPNDKGHRGGAGRGRLHAAPAWRRATSSRCPAWTPSPTAWRSRRPGDKIFPYIQQNLDDILTLDDGELVDAFLDMMEKHKMIVENAGLLTVAALKHLGCKGKNVVPILSGGNMDVITVASLVQHGLVRRGRVFTFSVQLPDRPGELVRVAELVAGLNGNIIKLEHNQFVNINRQAGVELRVTLEAFGMSHKAEIMDALQNAGYDAKEVMPGNLYD